MNSRLVGSGVSTEQVTNTKQTKDIMNNLHVTIKHNDGIISKLTNEMRTKEDSYKKIIGNLNR